MSADVLNKAELILSEAEDSLNGFVVALQRRLCHAALELLRDTHKHLTEAHAVLSLLDDVPPALEQRYVELTSGLQGATIRFRKTCQ